MTCLLPHSFPSQDSLEGVCIVADTVSTIDEFERGGGGPGRDSHSHMLFQLGYSRRRLDAVDLDDVVPRDLGMDAQIKQNFGTSSSASCSLGTVGRHPRNGLW